MFFDTVTAPRTGSATGTAPVSATPPSVPAASVPAASVPATGPGETLSNLRRLKKGMSADEVWAILGKPEKSELSDGTVIYYLENGSLVFVEDGKLTNAVINTGRSLIDADLHTQD
ncbi:MAG: hypothetical protein SGJ19_24425 [Planctomycetia bacterium]|nr:hypothetical protein [Planctomycetia bacterium]